MFRLIIEQMKNKIIEGIHQLKEYSNDHEMAHVYEDDLYEGFVKYVIQCDDLKYLKECAKELLKSKDIDFQRWCA